MKWMSQKHVDLGSGSVGRLLLSLAAPTITSQIVNMLYNLVDRVYIGHMQPTDTVGKLALTGVGVCLPVILIISAFAALMAMGGDIGCSAGPWLTGFVSDAAAKSQWLLDKTGMEAEQVALRAGLIAAVVFPVTLVLLVRCIGRKRKET